MAKKKETRFEEEGKGLGESAPDVNPADFGSLSGSDSKAASEEIDLSPATSSIAVVASTARTPVQGGPLE